MSLNNRNISTAPIQFPRLIAIPTRSTVPSRNTLSSGRHHANILACTLER